MTARRNVFLALSVLALLSGCKTTDKGIFKPFDTLNGNKAAAGTRQATAAAEAVAMGRTDDALAKYARLYKLDKSDRNARLNYAQLLRRTGEPAKALEVLTPAPSDPLLLNERAATQIALGRFDEAEKTLDDVLNKKGWEDAQPDALNLKGVVLDARGMHDLAEKNFRAALDSWRGDAVPVMNNLALCLAAQGSFDEALTMLRRALLAAPHRSEIAGNIGLIEKLRENVVPKAPVSIAPQKKIQQKK
jgi:Flp pilus assembly protein TadD